jgi:hypothetical protein
MPHLSSVPYVPRPGPTVENGGSSTIEFVPVDLRPSRRVPLERRDSTDATGIHTADVKCTWTATATNVNRQASGAFTIGMGDVVEVTESLKHQG